MILEFSSPINSEYVIIVNMCVLRIRTMKVCDRKIIFFLSYFLKFVVESVLSTEIIWYITLPFAISSSLSDLFAQHSPRNSFIAGLCSEKLLVFGRERGPKTTLQVF